MKHETRERIREANRVNPQPVTIITCKVGGYQMDSKRKTFDWHNKSDQKWLRNHLRWAMLNNHEVTLVPR